MLIEDRKMQLIMGKMIYLPSNLCEGGKAVDKRGISEELPGSCKTMADNERRESGLLGTEFVLYWGS